MASPHAKSRSAVALAELDGLRTEFKSELASHRRPVFSSRIGVVLSGGGARGAYEAGALMAFQDAQVPTHIVTASSVGSIKADSLVQAWIELSPATLGIDWSLYIFLLAGLVAASAGLGNLLWEWLSEHGIYLHAHHPKITWLSLAAAGMVVLFFADKLSYIGYVILNRIRRKRWELDVKKALISLAANLVVLGFLVLFLGF